MIMAGHLGGIGRIVGQVGDEVDPDEARRRAEEILRRREFAQDQPTLLDRAVDWVTEKVGDILGVIVSGGGSRFIGYAILAVALVALGYLLWRFAPRRRPSARSERPALSQHMTSGRTREQWLAEADAAEAAGHWDRAVHARYHALTCGLAEGSELTDDRSATSGEHRRAFAEAAADRPEQVARFDGATDRYEHVWFGGRAAGEGDNRAAAADDRALLERQR